MNTSPKQLEETAAGARIPAATYRLQFNRDFTFDQGRGILEYLRDLGISDAYASPLFQAGPESTHGYDLSSFQQLNSNLGSAADFKAFSARRRELGLGLLLDMVPNHMGNDLSNAWWRDVLALGPRSPFAEFFDIDWRPARSEMADKVLLPILEDHYASVLEAGKLKLACADGAFVIAYHDRNFPLAPHATGRLLEEAALALGCDERQRPLAKDVQQFALALKEDSATLNGAAQRVSAWTRESREFQAALASVCASYNGTPEDPRSFDKLDALLQEQNYRLAFWRVGSEEINYRRFFDVTQLVSVRMELPQVFKAAHDLVFNLIQSGDVTGLRIDHPDGLWDPKQYFERLQDACLQLNLLPPRRDSHEGKAPSPNWPLYVVAEKILTGDEPLPSDWPVAGTTGYDFLNHVNGLFVDSRNRAPFDELYRQFTGNSLSFRDSVYAGKKRILQVSLVSELNALASRLKQLATRTRYGRDYTFRQIHEALRELIANFPVYRTYATETSHQLAPIERSYVERAIAETKSRNPGIETALLDFLQELLLLRPPADLGAQGVDQNRQFVLKFQQLTGPVTAKGLEDTAFYNYTRLLSLNEVGGDADRFGATTEQFHQYNLSKAEQWPHSLLATATHDTKRGEDARARINVLSEMPEQWGEAIQRWSSINAGLKTSLNGEPAPHPNDEYLFYQSLIGVWPPDDASLLRVTSLRHEKTESACATARSDLAARLLDYMTKALREAKTRTEWTDPNEAYEKAVRGFIERSLDPMVSSRFLDDFQAFQSVVSYFGQFNSLSQLLLKLTCPGVPDFYQGTELWDFSLVDPDNRRPVDYSLRQRLLTEIKTMGHTRTQELLNRSHTGEIKLLLIYQALQFRRSHQELFSCGTYLPLQAHGEGKEHLCAFGRSLGDQLVITVAPRLVATLAKGKMRPPLGEAAWGETELELPSDAVAGRYYNVLTGERIEATPSTPNARLRMKDVLLRMPVALLARENV